MGAEFKDSIRLTQVETVGGVLKVTKVVLLQWGFKEKRT
jgi:hypothetical protein